MARTGRPTKYKKEYPKLLVEYFLKCQKKLATEKAIPFLSKFTREVMGVCEDTAIEWTKEYPEFSEAYKKAKEIQKECLIMGGLTGLFNPTAFIFTAKNITDMRDSQEVKHSGSISLTDLFNKSKNGDK